MTTQTFQPFPRLPLELRLLIFSHAMNPLSLPPPSFKLDSSCLSTMHCLRFQSLSGLEAAILGEGPDDGATLETTVGATPEKILRENHVRTYRRKGCESYYEALMMWKYTRCHWTEKVCGHWSDEGETMRCQRSLMGTCRIARGVVLEHWRNQMEEIGTEDVDGEGWEPWRREAVRIEVLEVLGRLIEAL